MTTGEVLKDLRGDIPRKTVADVVGVTLSAMSNYENDIRVPRDTVKKRIANFYSKTVDDIFYPNDATQSSISDVKEN